MTTTTTAPVPFNRLLLTGAAGGLGKVLRERLRPYAQVLRLSDIAAMAPAAGAHEEVHTGDLSDTQAVHHLVEGVDAILHFGGVSVERPFEEVLGANICGVFHIYEAARRHGVSRVPRGRPDAMARSGSSRRGQAQGRDAKAVSGCTGTAGGRRGFARIDDAYRTERRLSDYAPPMGSGRRRVAE